MSTTSSTPANPPEGFTFIGDDGIPLYGEEASAAAIAHFVAQAAARESVPADVREKLDAARADLNERIERDPIIQDMRHESAAVLGGLFGLDLSHRVRELKRCVIAEHVQRARLATRKTARVVAPCGSRSRSSHRGQSGHRRAAASSTTSSADPGGDEPAEPSSPRLCKCGCGESIAHKRADALTFSAACRKRLERATPLDDRFDLDLLLEDVLEDRRFVWAEAALTPFYATRAADLAEGQTGLTAEFGRELRAIYKASQVAMSKASTPRRSAVDDLHVIRWLMESNGVKTGHRLHGSPWKQPPNGGLRTGAYA